MIRHLLLVALASSVLSVQSAESGQPFNPPTYFGINGVGIFHRPNEEEELQRRWDLMRELGVKWDRSDFWWSDIEKRRGQWKYDKPDAAIHVYRAHDVQMFPILNYGAAWKNTEAPTNDAERADWARYVSNVVARYRPYANYWEVWNEPNIIPFWRPQPRVEDYAALLRVTADAARRANPDVKLVGFAMADMHKDFLTRTMELVGTNDFDAVSYHFYRTAIPERRTPDEVGELRLILRQFGKECPIWVTEMGVTSHHTEGVSEDLQAIYLMRQILLLIASGVERVFPFTLVDPTADPGGEWGNKLGMVDLNWRKKPAFDAYKTMIAELDAYQYVGEVYLHESVKALLFGSRPGMPAATQEKLVLWSTGGALDVRIPHRADLPLTCTRLLGSTQTVAVHNGIARLMVDSAPTYLPVTSHELRRNVDIRWAENPILAWPGFSPPALFLGAEPKSVKYTLPGGWECDEVMGLPFKVPGDARPGWYTVRAEVAHSSSTILRDLRVWVRQPLEVDFRPFITTASADMVTSVVIHNNNVRWTPADWRIESEPPIAGAQLPSGHIDVDSSFTAQTFAVRRNTLRNLRDTTQIRMRYVQSGGAMPGVSRTLDLFRIAVTPLAPLAPQVDGKLDEYAKAPMMYLGLPAQLSSGEYTSPHDASCTVSALWTDAGVYIGAEIADDHPMMNDRGAGGDVYKGDGVEVYIGPAGYDGRYYAKKEEGYWHFAISPGVRGRGAVVSDFEKAVQNARVAVESRNGGCTMEAFIPNTAFGGYRPNAGDVIAWDIQLNDRDDFSPEAKNLSFMWNGDDMNWLRTARWGLAVVK